MSYEQDVLSIIGNATDKVMNRALEAVSEYDRPSILLKPKLSIDGDQWCALYGDNLQDGIAGFGKSPSAAFYDFDKEYYKSLN